MIWGYHYFWKHLNDIGRLSPLIVSPFLFVLFFEQQHFRCELSLLGGENTEVKGVVKRNEAVQRVCRDVN